MLVARKWGLIHSMPWVLISRRMSREPPCRTSQTLFYLQADRTHSSDDGVLCSSRRLHGLSRPDTALCPLISRGWRPVGPVRQLRELSHCRQLGSSWSGPQSRCSSIGGQGSPVPTWWATVELRVEPSPTGRPKPCSSHQRPVGPTHAWKNRSLRARRLPRPVIQATPIPAPARSLVRILGGSQSGGCANISLLLGGTLGSGISRARSPSPGQHANNVSLYSPNTHYVTRAKYM